MRNDMNKFVVRAALVAFISLSLFSCGGPDPDTSPTASPTAPSAPTGVTATAGNGQATIAWTAVSGATSYNIYWSTTTGVTPANGTKMAGMVSPYQKTGLNNGTTYYFVVTAVNADGESVASTQASVTPAVSPPPTAPAEVAATPGNGQVTVSWTAAAGATSYNIYWSTSSGVTKTGGTKIPNATSPYTHAGRTNGTTYYYVVTAVNSFGESVESAQVSTTPTAGVSWTISTIDSTGDVGKDTSIAVDANEKVHISYFDFTNGKLKYATNVTGSWVASVIDSAGDDDTDIALDANGKVHIVYDGTGGDLKYATNAMGSWVISTVEIAAWSGSDSIAIDSNGKVHISYFKATDFDLKYATNASGAWSRSIVVNGGAALPFPAYSTSIGVDSNNKIHTSYYDDSPPDTIKYITNISGSWVVTTIDNIGFAAGWKTSLAVDSNNKVHISYYDWTNDAVKYASNASGTWQTETVGNSSGNVWSASLAIDKGHGNQIHIVYGSNSGPKYARKSAGAWQISTIDEAWTGSYSSIAIGSSSIHVSYYDGYNFNLKYATKPLF